jgi:hypothetical protein
VNGSQIALDDRQFAVDRFALRLRLLPALGQCDRQQRGVLPDPLDLLDNKALDLLRGQRPTRA